MTLAQHTITSSSGEYTRTAWYFAGPEEPHPLCIFLDAEHYIRDMQSLPVLEGLLESKEIPPVSLVFVSHVRGEARHFDYTCNDRYSQFIAEDVVRWAREKNASIQERENVICGLSLSGLAGAYITFQYPEIFSRSLCQSGSFWWFSEQEILLPPTKARFWLSVGDAETATGVTHPPTGLHQTISQITGVENAGKRFEALGGTVRQNMYSGGHAAAPWREELAPALKWLFEK
jgi:enterochelin esterase-like enzyme